MRAFKVYVRPILESATPVWSSWLLRDIHVVERVQRYFTRNVCRRCAIPFMNYAGRLLSLALESLELRRLVFDLCMVYKLARHLVDLPFENFFVRDNSGYALRGGHSCRKLRLAGRVHLASRQNFFSERIVPVWNSLREDVVSAPSLELFKSRLDSEELAPFCKLF